MFQLKKSLKLSHCHWFAQSEFSKCGKRLKQSIEKEYLFLSRRGERGVFKKVKNLGWVLVQALKKSEKIK